MERFKLSQAAIDFAVKSVNQIVTCVCEEVKLSIEEELESKGCHHINLSEVFRPINIFEGLETEYQQTQFCKEHSD